MSKFVTEAQLQRLKSAKEGSFPQRAYAALHERTIQHTQVPGIIQPGDPKEWWGLSERRAADAAFVWQVEHDPAIGEWIRSAALWICGRKDDEWVGPWFRNHNRPLCGHLETAHVAMAMCYFLDMCSELFTEDELNSMKAVLREHGMALRRRYCDGVLERGATLNNWYSVLLMGYGISSLVLEDEEAIAHTLVLMKNSQKLYNADSYGETLNYCDYASAVLMRLQDAVLCFRPDLQDRLNPGCYTRMAVWQAGGFLYRKAWDDKDQKLYSRYVNFGDCDATYKPRAEMLTHIAVRCKDTFPLEASLASWLFDTFYLNEADPDDINACTWNVILQQPDMAQAKSPQQLGLPTELFFDNGHAYLRDRWENPESVVAMRIGYQPLNASTHHHQDFGSFQLVVGRERMIVDGGSCCYRLNAQKLSASTLQHATVDLVDVKEQAWGFNKPMNPYGGVVGQRFVNSWFGKPEAPMVRTLRNEVIDGIRVIEADMTALYAPEATKVQRTFLCALPHVMVIIDRAETTRPLSLRTIFPLNNHDGMLETLREDDQHYTFYRRDSAVKLSEYLSIVDGRRQSSCLQRGWGYSHKSYNTRPNGDGQGKEGSAAIYRWMDAEPGRSHLRICTMTMAARDQLDGWRIEAVEDTLRILSPNGKPVLTLCVSGDQVSLLTENHTTAIG